MQIKQYVYHVIQKWKANKIDVNTLQKERIPAIWLTWQMAKMADKVKAKEKLEVMKEIAEKLNILIKPRKEVTQYQYKTNPKIKINGKSYTMLISKPLAKCHTDKFIYRFDVKKLDQKQ